MMSKCKVLINFEGLQISLNDLIHLVAYSSECSCDFNELCKGKVVVVVSQEFFPESQ